LEGIIMARLIKLNTRLNPKGIQGLKKKLIEEKITAKTFKAIIKRQILKQNNITPSNQKLKTLRHSIKTIRKNIELLMDHFSLPILEKKFKLSLKKI
jgi:hypothetical protein